MLKQREETRAIFVHCSATRPKQDIGARTIHSWHVKRGIYNERGLTGYHYVVRRSGVTELGRDLSVWGAHALGYNHASVGICLVGGARRAKADEVPEWGNLVSDDNFEEAQLATLEAWVRALLLIWPDAVVVPHYAVSTKACPSFDVWRWQQETFGYSDELRARKVLAEIRED